MSDHLNAAVVRRLAAALSAQDRSEIEAVLAADCIWRVPGTNVLSGDHAGRDQIMRLFGKMKRIFTGPAQFELIDVLVSDSYAAAYQYGIVTVGGNEIKLRECLVYRIRDRQIVEVDEFQFDLQAFNEAFSPEAVAAATGGAAS